MIAKRSIFKNLVIDLTVKDGNGKTSLNTNSKTLAVQSPLLFNFVKDISTGSPKILQWNSVHCEDAQDEHWEFAIQFNASPLISFQHGNSVDGSGASAPVLQIFDNGDINIVLSGNPTSPKMVLTSLGAGGNGTILITEVHTISNGQIRCQYTRTNTFTLNNTGGSFSSSFSSSFSTP